MKPREQARFGASMAHWPDALAFVEAFCQRHGLAQRDMLRLVLVAEELFTNVVEHGHGGGDAGAELRVELVPSPGRVALMIEDRAAPFDPLAQARAHPPALDADADARPVGGLGLHLVAQLAVEARYVREQGCNRVWIVLATVDGADTDQGAPLPR